MHSNNPFRNRQTTQPPVPLADSYYAPPSGNPTSHPGPNLVQSSNPDVESLANVFNQGFSLQEQPQQPQSVGPQHPSGYLDTSHSAAFSSYAPGPHHELSIPQPQPQQWESLQPPPSYSARPPSAPPEMPAPPSQRQLYPMRPDSLGPGNPAGFVDPGFPSAEGEKRRVHDRDLEREAVLPSSAGASSSQMRAPPQAQPSRSPGDFRTPSQGFRGPSQPPSNSMLGNVLGRVNPRNPLDPLPASFSRPVPPPIIQGLVPQLPGMPPYYGPLQPFPPMTLYAKEKFLDGGFPILPPPSPVQPHPFAHRDILEMDWVRFLEDLKIAGRLTGGQKVVAGVLPMTMNLGLSGILVSKVIEKGMKKKKNGPVAELVDTWNHHFFRPRRVLVILAHGPENMSGEIEGPAPDWYSQSGSHHHPGRGRSNSSSSSSSSSDDHRRRPYHGIEEKRHRRDDRRERKQERRDDRRERKQERREAHRERRDARRAGRHHMSGQTREERYRLVIISI